MKGNGTDNPAAEMAVYLTYLAYSSGGMGAVKTAVSALKFYTNLQGQEGNHFSDPLIHTVLKGLEGTSRSPCCRRRASRRPR